MGPGPVFIFGQLTPRDASPCVCIPHYYILFYGCSPFPLPSCCFRCVSPSLSLPLSSCLSCIPPLIGLPFLRSLLTMMLFLPYAYHVVAFCLFLLFLLLFAFFFLLSIFYFIFLLCPFLATMSFAGYFLVRFLLSAFPVFFPSERVPGLIWFGSVYLVTPAGFGADPFM